jgi:hypothetical protein
MFLVKICNSLYQVHLMNTRTRQCVRIRTSELAKRLKRKQEKQNHGRYCGFPFTSLRETKQASRDKRVRVEQCKCEQPALSVRVAFLLT